jgi:NAD(P)-dependent dehydrogenase (short-subunit alcohol dehydrogenase family)
MVCSSLYISQLPFSSARIRFVFETSAQIGGWVCKWSTFPHFRTNDIPALHGKVAIVTGANTGIGLESARELARKGAEVVVCARSKAKGEAAVAAIKKSIARPDANVYFMQLDLASLVSVEEFSKDFLALDKPIDILLLNAGIMKSPGEAFVGKKMSYGFEMTRDGFEGHIGKPFTCLLCLLNCRFYLTLSTPSSLEGVNHIGHFYLTNLLENKLKQSSSRVVAVSSCANVNSYPEGIRYDLWRERGADYEDGHAYGQSKLANILFAQHLAKRLSADGVTAYSCHPGVIKTELSRYMEPVLKAETEALHPLFQYGAKLFSMFFESIVFTAADGALTQLQLATLPAERFTNGAYYFPIGRETEPEHPAARKPGLSKELWERTEAVIAEAVQARAA